MNKKYLIKLESCKSNEPSAGNCMPSNRSDKTSVIFKEVNNMEIKNN